MRARFIAVLGCALVSGVAACSSNQDAGGNACSDIAIDRFKELEIVDESVTNDPRTLNASRGHWSFAYAMESIAGGDAKLASDMMYEWLYSWAVVNHVNLSDTPVRYSVSQKVLCPWLKRSDPNQCNDDCSQCTSHTLDLSSAPFRLIAIADRIDLRATNENGQGTEGTNPNGEGRLVFGLTNGPADDPASTPMNMTAITEFRLPTGGNKDAKYWADRWHSLGKFTAFDESYKQALQALTDEFTAKGADPGAPNGSALGQVRTNEKEFDWQWELREFHLTPDGQHLAVAATLNTPDQKLNGSQQLHDYVVANRQAILQEKVALPTRLEGASAIAGFTWSVPGVDEQLRKAFAKQTCNGCHLVETPTLDQSFQVSPLRKGIDKVSPFLNNPADPQHDDLAKRGASLQSALCGK